MSIFQDFKKFVLRGNVIDLAVGFTVGAAFTTLVTSLVSDIIMPPVGMLTGKSDFSDKFIILDVPSNVTVPEGGFQTLKAAQEAGVVTVNYGLFLNNCIALLLVALAMFIIIRAINRLDKQLEDVMGSDKAAEDEPTDKKCTYCRSTIPYRATRCPHCTSELPDPTEQPA